LEAAGEFFVLLAELARETRAELVEELARVFQFKLPVSGIDTEQLVEGSGGKLQAVQG
jgi:hypothetical protein